jgi:peptidoglycan/LPS O-acetylase OafA/YrhL
MSGNIFHLRGLNGLRAIAAFAVVISHSLNAAPLVGLPAPERGLLLAGHGVTLFFAISGFLITYLLLLEKAKTGTIQIRSFYIRRILRIWPLYYFYLAVSILVLWQFMPDQSYQMLPFYIFLCANIPLIAGMQMDLIGHYWSLGVEEQFYLFWPWIVRKAKNLERFLLIFIAIFLLLKLAMWLYLKKTNIIWPYSAIEVSRFDCMAIGGLAAVWTYNKKEWFLKIVRNRLVEFGAWITVLLLAIEVWPIPSLISAEFVASISVILIINVSADRRRLLNLDNQLFDFLGKISYGVYVYHPIVIFFVTKWLSNTLKNENATLKYAYLFSLVVAFTILIAWLSYNFFEKRFLQLKESYAIVQSRGSLVSK